MLDKREIKALKYREDDKKMDIISKEFNQINQ